MARLIERVEAMLRGEIPGPPAARLIGFQLLSIEPGARRAMPESVG